jgi:hypothetical protein
MEITARQAIKSDDYVAALEGMPKLTHKQKQEALFKILSDKSNAMKRLGQAMIGPIQVRLRYEGITRNVLVEDTLEKGPVLPYDVLDDLGQAYILNQTDSEVKITPFEGKQVYPHLFRVASFPRVRKEDLYYLRMNIIEFAQDESRQAIMKQEDARLMALLGTAITSYETVTGVSVTQNIGVGNPIELVDFYNAVSILEQRQIEARRVLINPADLRDIYTWDAHVTGWQFKDRVFGGQAVTEFGEFTIQKSIIVPQGKVFILPEPNFLGVLPVMYSLDVEENNQVEQFYRGWVMDELIGMVVLNPRGLALVNKA